VLNCVLRDERNLWLKFAEMQAMLYFLVSYIPMNKEEYVSVSISRRIWHFWIATMNTIVQSKDKNVYRVKDTLKKRQGAG
jgi:hypothetical protein